jgi:opacity protein-like surface antigen
MMKLRRVVQVASAIALFAITATVPAQAQVRRVESGRNAIGFNFGYFSLRGLDSRGCTNCDPIDQDVLVADLSQGQYSLAFDIKDFNGATFGGEWVTAIGDYLEAGFGAGFYQNTVHSVYAQKIRDDGSEIAQDLKLRVVPLTATVRFLPIGRGGVVPYVGAGIGAFNWHYSEVGEFIFQNDVTDNDRFLGDGWAVGPVVLGGIRFPVTDVWTVGGEIRWQKAEGKGLLDQNEFFLGDKIDLGGWNYNFTVHLKF